MKWAFSTVACMDLSYREVLDAAARHGMHGVEVRLDSDGGFFGLYDDALLRQAADGFRRAGVAVTNLGTSICLCGASEHALAQAREAAGLARSVGAPAIRVFLGNFAMKKDTPVQPIDHAGLVQTLRSMCDAAAQQQVEIWVETHNEYATGQALSALYREVGRDSLRFIWDVMHTIEQGEPLEETWRLIGRQVAHVHIKDGFDRRDPAWNEYQYCALGEGALPLAALLSLLEQEGFPGFVSLEWEARWRPELQAYPAGLDWLLGQFTAVLARREGYPVPRFDSRWQPVWPEQYPRPAYTVSPHGVCASFQTDGSDGPFRELSYEFDGLEEGAAYTWTVEYSAKDTWHALSVCAVAAVLDQNGWPVTRTYAEHIHPGKLRCVAKLPAGASRVQLSLGLKGPGRVDWYLPSLVKCGPAGHRKANVVSTFLFPGNVPATMAENLERIGRVFDKAGALQPDLVLFAETINDRGFEMPFAQKCETIDGPFCTLMREKARQYHCYCMFTLHERAGDKYHNTAVLVGRDGEIAGLHRKTHLTYMEYSWGMTPGHEHRVFDTDFGKVGMLVCWDAYFPEPARELAQKGAELLLVSTAGNPSSRHTTRAMENGVFVAVAGAGVEEEGCLPSKIIDPAGRVLSQTMEDEGLAQAVIDLDDKPLIDWLSMGPCASEPHNVYWNEYRPDLAKKAAAEQA